MSCMIEAKRTNYNVVLTVKPHYFRATGQVAARRWECQRLPLDGEKWTHKNGLRIP